MTNEQYEQLVNNLKTQDNHITANPIFLVQTWHDDYWQYDTAHFTLAAAEDYIRQNGHNLKNPRIYVDSQYRCDEWNAVREALMNGELVLKKD